MTIQAILCILDLCLNFLAVASLSIRISSVLCFVLVTQSCLTLCDPMNYSPPGSFVHGILQARILEWWLIPSPGDLPDPGMEEMIWVPFKPTTTLQYPMMSVQSVSSVVQSCPTLCNPMDCTPPGSFVHGIFQARIW